MENQNNFVPTSILTSEIATKVIWFSMRRWTHWTPICLFSSTSARFWPYERQIFYLSDSSSLPRLRYSTPTIVDSICRPCHGFFHNLSVADDTVPDDRYPPSSLPSTCMPENICPPMPLGFREAPTLLYCSSIHSWTNTFMEAVLQNVDNLWPTNFQFFYQYN